MDRPGGEVRTLVIILAQGQQTRLPDLPISKTMLPLFVRDSDGLDLFDYAAVMPSDLEAGMLAKPRTHLTPRITIIERTIAQLGHMWSRQELTRVAVRVVASEQTMSTMIPNEWLTGVIGGRGYVADPHPHDAARGASAAGAWTRWVGNGGQGVAGLTFEQPRNSSLRGIADTMCALACDGDLPLDRKELDLQIVVLFGDTVYTWECLRELMRSGADGHGFVVSGDLSRSSGEVWGLSWCMKHDVMMCNALAAALRHHPPVNNTYQVGQMRRWLFELCGGDIGNIGEHAVCIPNAESPDDYTRDIDVPAHLKLLPELAAKALADDRKEGLLYGTPARY